MNPPKMPIHIGDLYRDTGHLRAAGFGGYLALMFHYWSTGSLPDDDEQLATIARMTRREWKKHKPTIKAFFKNGWEHKRIDADLSVAKASYEKRAQAGQRGGNAKAAGKQSSSNATAGPELPNTLNLEEERKKEPADAGTTTNKYAFESGIIRLNQKDFDQWKQSFSYLDVPAELISMAAWAGEQGPSRWFNAVSNLLAKRNREAKAARESPQQDENKRYWGNRIPGIS